MSADKHRSLARRIAWLRHLSEINAEGVLVGSSRATGIKGLPHITEDLLRLEAGGLVCRGRTKIGFMGQNGYATTFAATSEGVAFLTETLQKRGEAFGPVSLVRQTQEDRPNKKERALRRETPVDRRLKKQAARERRALFVERLEGWARRACLEASVR